MQLGVLDGPAEDLLRRRRVADVVDREVEIHEAAKVRVRSAAVLLELDVGGSPGPVVSGDSGELMHLFAAACLFVEVGDGDARILGADTGRETAADDQPSDDEDSAHQTSRTLLFQV